LAALTAGVVTATASDTAANLAGMAIGATDAITMTVTAGAVTAANLNTANGLGAGVLNASAATAITGTATQLATLKAAVDAGQVTIAADVPVTITDTPTLAQLATIDAMTTGSMTYVSVIDTAANLSSNSYVAAGVNVTITDAATIAQLTSIDNANAAGTLNLAAAGIRDTNANLIADIGGYILRNAGVNLVVTDTSLSTTQALAVAALTTGQVTATISNTDVTTLLALNNGAEVGNAVNAFAITINDASVTAVNLLDIDDNAASITVNANSSSNVLNFADYTGAGTIGLTINSGDRDDAVTGGANADTINGGNGNDTMTGGAGADSLTGGLGADTFVLTENTTADVIVDFSVALDDILSFDISGLGLNAADYVAGAVTIVTGAGGNGLANAAASNHIIVDTAANIALMIDADSAWTGAAIAIETDTGRVLYDANADFSAGAVSIGTVTAAQAALITADNLSFIV